MRTVWVVGVLDGMSSRLNEFGLPTGCLNTAGMALASAKEYHNDVIYVILRGGGRLSCEMMWLWGIIGRNQAGPWAGVRCRAESWKGSKWQ